MDRGLGLAVWVRGGPGGSLVLLDFIRTDLLEGIHVISGIAHLAPVIHVDGAHQNDDIERRVALWNLGDGDLLPVDIYGGHGASWLVVMSIC